MADMRKFSADLDKAVKEKVIKKLVQTQIGIAIRAYQMITADSLLSGMQFGSPVWTGRFRASHTISIGTIDTTVEPPLDEPGLRWPDAPDNPIRNKALSYASNVLAGLKPFDVVYIANSLPYARRLENGWSTFKAPEGVYDVTVAALKARLRAGGNMKVR